MAGVEANGNQNLGLIHQAVARGIHIAEISQSALQLKLGGMLLGYLQNLLEQGYVDYPFSPSGAAPGAMTVRDNPLAYDVEYIYRDARIEHRAEKRLLTIDGREKKITPTESNLLILLTNPPDRVVPFGRFGEVVWPETAWDKQRISEYTRVYVGRLRAQLEDPDHRYVSTIPTSGYMYNAVGEWSVQGIPPINSAPRWTPPELLLLPEGSPELIDLGSRELNGRQNGHDTEKEGFNINNNPALQNEVGRFILSKVLISLTNPDPNRPELEGNLLSYIDPRVMPSLNRRRSEFETKGFVFELVKKALSELSVGDDVRSQRDKDLIRRLKYLQGQGVSTERLENLLARKFHPESLIPTVESATVTS